MKLASALIHLPFVITRARKLNNAQIHTVILTAFKYVVSLDRMDGTSLCSVSCEPASQLRKLTDQARSVWDSACHYNNIVTTLIAMWQAVLRAELCAFRLFAWESLMAWWAAQTLYHSLPTTLINAGVVGAVVGGIVLYGSLGFTSALRKQTFACLLLCQIVWFFCDSLFLYIHFAFELQTLNLCSLHSMFGV